VKWLVSSRPRHDIETRLQKSGGRADLHLEQNADYVSRGVDAYIDHKMSDLLAQYKETYADRDPEVLEELHKAENEVAKELRRKADGTFLWVALVFKQIKEEECNSDGILAFFRKMPPDLNRMYEQMMAQMINRQDGNFRFCQQALLVAYRPLRLSELARLAGLPILAAPRDIVLLCGLFAIRESQKTVSFVHQLANDYLTNTASKVSARIFPDGHADGHRTIVIRSIAAMNEVLRKDICSLGRPDFCIIDGQTPHLDPLKSILYSCVYWIDHLCEMASDHDRIGLVTMAALMHFGRITFSTGLKP
jgi:hypothetical protein